MQFKVSLHYNFPSISIIIILQYGVMKRWDRAKHEFKMNFI